MRATLDVAWARLMGERSVRMSVLLCHNRGWSNCATRWVHYPQAPAIHCDAPAFMYCQPRSAFSSSSNHTFRVCTLCRSTRLHRWSWPLHVGRPYTGKKKKGACRGENPHLAGRAARPLTCPIWALARQGYLVGPASLMTHRPGRIIKAGPWPSSQRETPHLQGALSCRSSIWGRLHRATNRADRHALSEHVVSMRML